MIVKTFLLVLVITLTVAWLRGDDTYRQGRGFYNGRPKMWAQPPKRRNSRQKTTKTPDEGGP